jgi:hypothetical protein
MPIRLQAGSASLLARLTDSQTRSTRARSVGIWQGLTTCLDIRQHGRGFITAENRDYMFGLLHEVTDIRKRDRRGSKPARQSGSRGDATLRRRVEVVSGVGCN